MTNPAKRPVYPDEPRLGADAVIRPLANQDFFPMAKPSISMATPLKIDWMP
jgi:hypothetical protein